MFSNPADSDVAGYTDAKKIIRKAASDLVQANGSVRWYPLLRFLRIAPKRESVTEIVGLLTEISNNLFDQTGYGPAENSKSADQILTLMR